MARTVTDIYDALATEMSTQSSLSALQPQIDVAQDLLADLTSPSSVARWRLFLWVVAVGQWVHETMWDLFMVQILGIVAAAESGTCRWYQQQVLAFQYGDALVWNGTKFVYATINTANRIVAYCAVTEVSGQVLIKVAKSVSNVITPLAAGELTALTAYVQDIRFAGTETVLVSNNPDLLKLTVKAYYNPLVLDSTGQSISNPGSYPIRDAINAYLNALPFNGEFVITFLENAMEAATGIVDAIVETAQYKIGSGPYTDIVDYYQADAGYLVIDGAFPLSTSITYIPAP